MRPRLLDLFCGAGGAAMGYHRAGFEVVGVDINPQPHYPFQFWQVDVMELGAFESLLSELAPHALHASPPCQHYSALSNASRSRDRHPDLIDGVRRKFELQYRPWVIENVPRSPLIEPAQLCGTMFDLRVIRHRWFETSFPLIVPACHHNGKVSDGTYVGHRDGGKVLPGRVRPPLWTAQQKREAVGIDWMPLKAMRQAIPPAYTQFIGEVMLKHVG